MFDYYTTTKLQQNHKIYKANLLKNINQMVKPILVIYGAGCLVAYVLANNADHRDYNRRITKLEKDIAELTPTPSTNSLTSITFRGQTYDLSTGSNAVSTNQSDYTVNLINKNSPNAIDAIRYAEKLNQAQGAQ